MCKWRKLVYFEFDPSSWCLYMASLQLKDFPSKRHSTIGHDTFGKEFDTVNKHSKKQAAPRAWMYSCLPTHMNLTTWYYQTYLPSALVWSVKFLRVHSQTVIEHLALSLNNKFLGQLFKILNSVQSHHKPECTLGFLPTFNSRLKKLLKSENHNWFNSNWKYLNIALVYQIWCERIQICKFCFY